MTISKDRLKRPISVIGTLSFTLYALQHHVAQLGLPQLVRGSPMHLLCIALTAFLVKLAKMCI